MQVILKVLPRHVQLTPALRAYACDKLARHAARLATMPSTRMEVVLTRHGGHPGCPRQCCRVAVFVARSRPVVITAHADSAYQAIDRSHRRLSMALKRGRRRQQRDTTAPRRAAAAAASAR